MARFGQVQLHLGPFMPHFVAVASAQGISLSELARKAMEIYCSSVGSPPAVSIATVVAGATTSEGQGVVGTIPAKREVSVSISSPYSSEKKETTSSAAPNEPPPADAGRAQAPAEPALLLFNCIKGKRSQEPTWPLGQTLLSDLEETFADMDVLAEARKARAWIDALSSRRKTHDGMKKFLTDWCIRGQNRGSYARRNGAALKSSSREAVPLSQRRPMYVASERIWAGVTGNNVYVYREQWDESAEGMAWPCTQETWRVDLWGPIPEDLPSLSQLPPPDQPGQSVEVSH